MEGAGNGKNGRPEAEIEFEALDEIPSGVRVLM